MESGFELGVPDLLNDLRQEPDHHEATGFDFTDAPRLQIEQLFIIETPGRAGVTRAENVPGLYFEVRDGVGPGALGEHEVAILLIAVRSRSIRADQYIADPDRSCADSLKRALVVDSALRVCAEVVQVDALFEMLAGISEVQAV